MGITPFELKNSAWAILWFMAFIWVAIGLKEWFEENIANGETTLWIGLGLFLFILWAKDYKGSIAFRR